VILQLAALEKILLCHGSHLIRCVFVHQALVWKRLTAFEYRNIAIWMLRHESFNQPSHWLQVSLVANLGIAFGRLHCGDIVGGVVVQFSPELLSSMYGLQTPRLSVELVLEVAVLRATCSGPSCLRYDHALHPPHKMGGYQSGTQVPPALLLR
jgi:hypothetical protein